MARACIPVLVSPPAAPLRAHISHYWLSLDNSDDTYSISPDGTVDVVVSVGAAAHRVDIFGTTTSRTALPLVFGSHYLGISFRPGQSRHFIDAQAAELTNAVRSADGTFFPDMLAVAESISTDSLFTRLDTLLLEHLKRRPPHHARIDDAIRYIEATHGSLRISRLADMYGKSRRQFERHFLDVVGLPAKLFAGIIRFQRASTLLAHSTLPLAHIAVEAGYSDQSHLAHEFSRFYGLPPSQARENVAFLQDACRLADHNEGSLST